MSHIRDDYLRDLPVCNVYEAPTVAQLAKYIDTMFWAVGVDKTQTRGLDRAEVEFCSIASDRESALR